MATDLTKIDEVTLNRARAMQCLCNSLIWRIRREVCDCEERERAIAKLESARDDLVDIILEHGRQT